MFLHNYPYLSEVMYISREYFAMLDSAVSKLTAFHLKLRADEQFFSQAKEKYPWSIFINDSEGLKTILLIDVVNCYKETGWQLARRMDLSVSQRFMIFNQGEFAGVNNCNPLIHSKIHSTSADCVFFRNTPKPRDLQLRAVFWRKRSRIVRA